MSDVYSTIFSDDPRTGALTAAQLQARRQIAIALATRNRPYPKTIGEGLTALGEGLGEGYFNTQVARAEGAQTAGDAAALRPPSGAVPPPAPSVAPAVPRAPAGRTSMDGDTGDTATQALAYAAPPDATETTQPLTTAQASQQPQMSIDEWMQRAARNETGAEKDPYNAVGPISRRGDHAYGKYQVMGENVPVWTKKYLGEEMTPQEFLADKDAQDQVARGKGGEYLAKYGPTGAAAAWFAGENGMNDPNRKDTLGTHVAEYQRRFNIPLVSRDQVAASAANAAAQGGDRPVQVASLGGMPTSDTAAPDTAPDATTGAVRDAVAQKLLAQNGVQPPQQVAQAPPTAPQVPLSPPRIGPQVPPFPAYGEEPKPPQPTPDMIHYRRVAADPYRSDQTKATAMQIYTEMKAAQDQEFARKYELWKANDLKQRDYTIGLPKAQEDLTNAYLDALKKPQGIITGQQGPTAPQVQSQAVPVSQPQAGPDPRLGTDQSPQRTGIPTPPAKPADQSLEEWSKLQGPLMSKAQEAVQKAVPDFNDAIATIQLARRHPGNEYGVGTGASIAQQLPWTDAAGFGKIMQQIQGKNFLAGYQTLKGGGSITEVEGKKTEQAQARVATDQKRGDWEAAMNDLETQLRRDLELAQRKVNMPVTAWRGAGDNSSYAPDIGQVKGDHQYIGGDPSSPMSWKKFR
jgi:hypothetical protein